ncbi:MAG: hypothetical protein KA273_02860, partial [Bacteroidales bacterium]|nr:hypothetical protein [Bacteroidales bacterium]
KVNLSPKKKYLFPKTNTLIRYAAALLLLLAVGTMVLWIQPSELSDPSNQISQSNAIDSIGQKVETIVKDEPIVSSNEKVNFNNESLKPQNKVEEKAFQEIELTEEELEYLEYYLEADVLNDYLTYNDVEL